MANSSATKPVGKLFTLFSIFLIVLFTGVAAALGYGGWLTWPDFQLMQSPPRTASLYDLSPIEPGQKLWVTVTGLEWKCPQILKYEGKLQEGKLDEVRVFPLHDAVTGSLVIVEGQKGVNCGTEALTGILSPISDRYRNLLKEKGWAIFDNYRPENIYTLCTGCSPRQARLELNILGSGIAFCLLMILIFGRKRKERVRTKAKVPPQPPVAPTAPVNPPPPPVGPTA